MYFLICDLHTSSGCEHSYHISRSTPFQHNQSEGVCWNGLDTKACQMLHDSAVCERVVSVSYVSRWPDGVPPAVRAHRLLHTVQRGDEAWRPRHRHHVRGLPPPHLRQLHLPPGQKGECLGPFPRAAFQFLFLMLLQMRSNPSGWAQQQHHEVHIDGWRSD